MREEGERREERGTPDKEEGEAAGKWIKREREKVEGKEGKD